MTQAQFRAELHAEIDRHWRRIERLKFTRRAHKRTLITITSGKGAKPAKRAK